LIRFQWLDYLATLRERKTWLGVVIMTYAMFSMPILLERPPEHVRRAITTWFGPADPFVVFMYVWLDLAMNKVIAFLPVVMASGVVLRERDNRVLPLVASKPISMPRYFALRTISACAVIATLHVGTQLVGAFWFSMRVPGFRVASFLGAMSLHLGAALFATALAAAIAAWVKHRTASALVGFAVLNGMVGLALVGFYQPAWRGVTMLNPITLGSSALGHLESLRVTVIVIPMVALVCITVVTIAIGALGVRRMEA
jgi:ABC-2 type transport system permease protein